MQDSRLVPIFAGSPAEPQQQEQVNTSQFSELPTGELVGLQLDKQQTLDGPESPPDAENIQAAQTPLELRTSQLLPAAERRHSGSGGVLFGRRNQADGLSGQLDRLTVDPRFILTPTSLPEPFPTQVVVISTANDAPIETLHFIEVCVFHRRQPWRTVLEELRKQNVFMQGATMTGILRQWLAIVEIAMFRKPRRDENFSQDILVILERYQSLVRDGHVEQLRETWQLLTAMLNEQEMPE